MEDRAHPIGDIPRLARREGGWDLEVDGRPFLILGGELGNSSSSSLTYLEPIWPGLVALKLNTVLAAVSWELIEPEEGKFNFTLVDGLIDSARRHGLKLIILWFGTWKNACSSYAPGWVKMNLQRFFRAQCVAGRSHDAISCFCEEACAADARAFRALMRHIRERDAAERTVIMVQVENETGLLGSPRDRSRPAEDAFRQRVPDELSKVIVEGENSLAAPLRAAWEDAGRCEGGTWEEMFGRMAEEAFMAWHVARFVDRVAAAGKDEYPLPMFVNAWLVQHEGQVPGAYPSGGPVWHMLDIWRAAAPHIDSFAPDIYLDDFVRVCDEYTRPWNPLIIPEAHRDARAAANAFCAFGRGALCFSPFGIDRLVTGRPLELPPEGRLLAKSYELLAPLAGIIAEARRKGRLVGFGGRAGGQVGFILGEHTFQVRFDGCRPESPWAGGLLVSFGSDEYLAAGLGFTLEFRAAGGKNVDILWSEEGRYDAAGWSPLRRLNGDENGAGHWIRCGCEPELVRFKLYEYV